MNKDFTKNKLTSFSEQKQIKALYDLARWIESEKKELTSSSFNKLKKYHDFLADSHFEKIQKLNKEFQKVAKLDFQFQIYLMLAERFLGQSLKEYDFMVATEDGQTNIKEKLPITLVLDSLRSAHNIGAIFRTADCFNIKKIVLTGLSPDPGHEQVKKTCMGSDEHVDWIFEPNILEYIEEQKSLGYKIYGIETGKHAIDINQVKTLEENAIFILGHEQFGISFEVLKECHQIIKIPMYGQKNSLNVSVSCGIILNRLRDIYKEFNS